MEKKIKIIDLLNKIANGEIPKLIRTMGDEWKYINGDYWCENCGGWFSTECLELTILNDEVEILDEEDEFEDIDEVEVYHQYNEAIIKNYGKESTVNLGVELLADKINDLIKNQKKIIEKINEKKC